MAAFSTRRHLRVSMLVSLAMLLIGAVFAIPDAYENIRQMLASATIPVPFYRYAVAWAQQCLKHEEFVFAAAVIALANCLVLRALGGKLVRPGGLLQNA